MASSTQNQAPNIPPPLPPAPTPPQQQQPVPPAFVIHPEPKKTWMDRLVDAMIGDDSAKQSKYALICQRCHAHNGLALPDEILTLGTQIMHSL